MYLNRRVFVMGKMYFQKYIIALDKWSVQKVIFIFVPKHFLWIFIRIGLLRQNKLCFIANYELSIT